MVPNFNSENNKNSHFINFYILYLITFFFRMVQINIKVKSSTLYLMINWPAEYLPDQCYSQIHTSQED